MAEEHMQTVSRQCKGMSDPEGASPKVEVENTPSTEATFANEVRRGTKFDDPGTNCCNEGKMEEAHSSSTR